MVFKIWFIQIVLTKIFQNQSNTTKWDNSWFLKMH